MGPQRVSASMLVAHVEMLVKDVSRTLASDLSSEEKGRIIGKAIVADGVAYTAMTDGLLQTLASHGIFIDPTGEKATMFSTADSPLPIDGPYAGPHDQFTPQLGTVRVMAVQIPTDAHQLYVTFDVNPEAGIDRRLWVGPTPGSLKLMSVPDYSSVGLTPKVTLFLTGGLLRAGDVVYVHHAYEADLAGLGEKPTPDAVKLVVSFD